MNDLIPHLIFEIIKFLPDRDIYNFLSINKKVSNIFNLDNITKNYLKYRQKSALIDCYANIALLSPSIPSYPILRKDNDYNYYEFYFLVYNKNNKFVYYNYKIEDFDVSEKIFDLKDIESSKINKKFDNREIDKVFYFGETIYRKTEFYEGAFNKYNYTAGTNLVRKFLYECKNLSLSSYFRNNLTSYIVDLYLFRDSVQDPIDTNF